MLGRRLSPSAPKVAFPLSLDAEDPFSASCVGRGMGQPSSLHIHYMHSAVFRNFKGERGRGGGAMPSVLPFPASLNAPQIAEHNTKHNLPVKGSGLIANYNLLSCNVTICSAGV